MKFPYAAKAVLWQWFAAGVLGSLLSMILGWLATPWPSYSLYRLAEDERLSESQGLAEALEAAAGFLGAYGACIAAVPVFFLGARFARRTLLPKIFYRRMLPLLALPLCIAAVWTLAMQRTDGDYRSREFLPAWVAARPLQGGLLLFRTHWYAENEGRYLYEEVPNLFRWVSRLSLDNGFDHEGARQAVEAKEQEILRTRERILEAEKRETVLARQQTDKAVFWMIRENREQDQRLLAAQTDDLEVLRLKVRGDSDAVAGRVREQETRVEVAAGQLRAAEQAALRAAEQEGTPPSARTATAVQEAAEELQRAKILLENLQELFAGMPLGGDLPSEEEIEAFGFLRSQCHDLAGLRDGLAPYLFWLLGGFWGARRSRQPLASMRGAVPVALLCAAVGGALFWQEYRRAETLLSKSYAQTSATGDTLRYSPISRDSLLVAPVAPPSLRIRANHPRLDGATAFYPVYAAAFKATYVPPGMQDWPVDSSTVPDDFRSLLNCTTTRKGYTRLINGEVDVFFGLAPSPEQLRKAADRGVTLRLIPLAKDAFVFFTHRNNPVRNLGSRQIRDIYTRRLVNWKETGGSDSPVLPFQRPANAGSQTTMEHLVMRGEPMARPLREEVHIEMEGVLLRVAEYRNDGGAIGYSFLWYATRMRRTPGIDFLAVDGVFPSQETIADGSYPFIATYYAVVREGDTTPQTRALVDWLSGPEGQALIAKTGYAPADADAADEGFFGNQTPVRQDPERADEP